MKMLRWLGALLLVLGGWCAGDAHRARLADQTNALRRTVQLLRRIRQEVAYRRTDFNVLYHALYAGDSRELGKGGSLQQLAPPDAFSEEEKACFRECMSGLGRTAAQQECERLDYYIQRFEDFLQDTEQKLRAEAGLAHRLGLAAGAMLALLFL